MEELIFEGKTLEEAIKNACDSLNIEKEKLKYEVIDEGSKGFLHFFHKKAKIKILLPGKEEVESKIDKLLDEELSFVKEEIHEISDEKQDEVISDSLETSIQNNIPEKKYENEDIIANIENFIIDFFKILEINARLDKKAYDEKVFIYVFTQGDFIPTNNFEDFIYSLNLIVNKIVQIKFNSNLKFEVDVNDYIHKKIIHLKQMAKEISEKVKLEKKSFKLKPMYPKDRRVIHITLKKDKSVRTKSIGNGEKKQIIVYPAEERKTADGSKH